MSKVALIAAWISVAAGRLRITTTLGAVHPEVDGTVATGGGRRALMGCSAPDGS